MDFYAELDDETRWQMSVSDATERVRVAAEDEPGYSGARIDYDNRCLWLHGTGPRPSERLTRVIDEVADRLNVHWKQVRYSREELHAAHEALFDALPNAVTMSNTDDYSAVVAGIMGLPESGPERENLKRRAAHATDVPAILEPSGGVSLLL